MARITSWLGFFISFSLVGCGAPNYAPVRDANGVHPASQPSIQNEIPAQPSLSSAPLIANSSFDSTYTEPVLVDSLIIQEEIPAEQTPPTIAQEEKNSVIITEVYKPPETQLAETTPVPKPAEPPVLVSPDAGKSTWIWPSSGKVIRGFSKENKGLDIQGKRGDPVFASANGQVVYSGTGLRGYGQLVIIKHNADFVSAYAHNSTVLVEEGDTVKQGQKIAEVGDSGTDNVKLYFELRFKGKPTDPIKYLPKR